MLVNASKIARIAWNNNGWIKPSGKNGKPDKKDYNKKDEPPFEAKHGYGHEEWLFDTGKLVNGFQYAFLQPINTKKNKHSKKTYTIYLYTINNITKNRYFVGKINNVSVLDDEEANEIYNIYKKNNWLEEMSEQINEVGGDVEFFKTLHKLFNIKFKPSDYIINESIYNIPKSNKIHKLNHYILYEYENEFEQIVNDENKFEFNPSEPLEKSKDVAKKRNIEPKTIEIEYLHNQISKLLYKYLSTKYGKENVAVEKLAGYGGNKIDMILRNENAYTFFEIKTYSSIRESIREAIGQLIEYCYFPIEHRANELIIVSHLSENEEIIKYMEHLRNKLNIKVYYQYFDIEKETLGEKY